MTAPASSPDPNNCVWAMKLVGKEFETVKGADPICGEVIPGKTVSPRPAS